MNTGNAGQRRILEPLNITCTSTDCENGLHCFLATKKMMQQNEKGRCRECGMELIDWDRVYRRDLGDAANTFAVLHHELIRHHFWHVDIDQMALNYARRKGKVGLRAAVEKRICSSVGQAKPFRDGRQTPKEGNPIYYAQHATASCCRKCIEEWHGIEQGRELTDDEVQYLSSLAMLYIEERIPDLRDQGERVPFIRQR